MKVDVGMAFKTGNYLSELAKEDKYSAINTICAMIDVIAQVTEETAPELAEMVFEQVKDVNMKYGAYGR